MHKALLLLMAVLVAAMPLPALAQARPSELGRHILSQKPYGEGQLSVLWMDVYDVNLWTDAESWGYGAPFALSITYRMNFTRDELVERTFEEIARVQSDTGTLQRDYGDDLRRAFPDVVKGDRITALYKPGGSIEFFHNGQRTHRMQSPRFAPLFFGIWLDAGTSQPALRRGLLGL
jgi:hypothetical protein